MTDHADKCWRHGVAYCCEADCIEEEDAQEDTGDDETMSPSGQIQPGDVVTLASGGDRYVVGPSNQWIGTRAMCTKDVPGGSPIEALFHLDTLRKVEPEPPAMDDETRIAIMHAAAYWMSVPAEHDDERKTGAILRRWLDAQRGS